MSFLVEGHVHVPSTDRMRVESDTVLETLISYVSTLARHIRAVMRFRR